MSGKPENYKYPWAVNIINSMGIKAKKLFLKTPFMLESKQWSGKLLKNHLFVILALNIIEFVKGSALMIYN